LRRGYAAPVHVESTLAARARRFELSPTTFRRLALGSVAWLWLIVVTGATVRLTASGLGCEHWPGCTAGNPFPSKSYHSFIEFGNRIGSALTSLATLVGWAGARFTSGVPRWTRRLALATFLGTLAQAPLGAITVYAGLNPWLVMSHFLLALVVLAAGVVVAVEAVCVERGRARERLPEVVRRGAFVAAVALLALVVTGTISTAAGPHPGSADVERLWRLHAAVYVHVRATAIFGVLFLAFLVYVVRRRSRWPLYAEAGGALLFLLLVQMSVGELQYRTHLPWWLVLIHVGLAAAVWACAVAVATVIQRPPKPFAPT
jgi:cytochrome c oxidase assembly protein subunit 15